MIIIRKAIIESMISQKVIFLSVLFTVGEGEVVFNMYQWNLMKESLLYLYFLHMNLPECQQPEHILFYSLGVHLPIKLAF